MSDIRIERQHQLGLPRARRVATDWMAQARERWGLQFDHQPAADESPTATDQIRFSGMGAEGTWVIPVLKTVAEKGQGVAEVFAAVEQHREFLKKSGALSRKRAHFAQTAILHIVRDMAADEAAAVLASEKGRRILAEVSERKMDPFTAAGKIKR